MPLINLHDFEEQAKSILSEAAYSYFAGGAADELSVKENLSAFSRIQLLPRSFVDVSQRDLSITIIGQKVAMPVLIAPTAMAGLAHPDKEIGIANAAKTAGTIMSTSTLSNTSIEDLSQTGANLWFQLYVHKDRGMTRNLVERAEAAHCKALVLTVDVPVPGYREFSMRNLIKIPENIELANLTGYWDRDEYPTTTQYVSAQFDPSLTWTDLEQFVSSTKLPVLAKGIMRPDDAKRAVESGVAGIIVSNHGGRQLDTVPATIDVLASIVEAVDGACDVLLDGGVRRGTDVIKALALGAKAVLLGRPIVWGLSVDGQKGVEQVLEIIRREYDIAMALCGVTSSRDVPADLIFKP